MYGDLLLDQLSVNFLGPAPLDLELLHMLTTFHWNALGSTLGWWFYYNNTVCHNEKFWVEQVTPPPGKGGGNNLVGGGGGGGRGDAQVLRCRQDPPRHTTRAHTRHAAQRTHSACVRGPTGPPPPLPGSARAPHPSSWPRPGGGGTPDIGHQNNTRPPATKPGAAQTQTTRQPEGKRPRMGTGGERGETHTPAQSKTKHTPLDPGLSQPPGGVPAPRQVLVNL